METFVFPVLSFLVLLLIAWWTHLLSKRLRISYTILLVIVWILLVPIMGLPGLSFMKSFSLTPDLLFYVFLPILLFESAYNMKYREITKDNLAIWTLAIWWLLLSTAIIMSMMIFAVEYPFGISYSFYGCAPFWSNCVCNRPCCSLSIIQRIWRSQEINLIVWMREPI